METTNYTYDYAGRITAIANTANSALDWSYGYDVLDRLNSASVSGASYGWGYDANGNRTSQTGTTPWTLSIASTNNRLSSTSGTESRTYSYDSAGNTLSYNSITNTYNNRGRMKTADVSSATTTYVTNAMGQRAKKSGGGATTTYYIYDEAGHLIGEYDSSGALVQETVYLGDTPVATIRPNGASVDVFYVHADHLNTPKKVSRPSDNQLRWRWDQDPFGTAVPSQNPASLGTFVYNLRFPGQVYDSETGINYNYFRDYDPQVGRYVQSDPIGLVAGTNTYAYVSAAPTELVDPLGLAGRGPYQPSPQTAVEQAIIRGDIQSIRTLVEAGEISSAAAERAIVEIALKNRSTGNIRQLADIFKRNKKAIEEAIHRCKENLPRSAPERNPNVVVDKVTGDVYPLMKNGRLGDSIGNIMDALLGH